MIDDHTRMEAIFAGRQPDSGWGYIIIGIVFSFFGAVVASVDDGEFAGLIMLGLGGILATTGAVAVGVTVGMRRAEYRSALQLSHYLRHGKQAGGA